MLEWCDTIIKIDDFTNIKGTVLITEKSSYDMLFGLNACKAINGIIDVSLLLLRYAFKDKNNKDRFGKK